MGCINYRYQREIQVYAEFAAQEQEGKRYCAQCAENSKKWAHKVKETGYMKKYYTPVK